MVRLAPLIPIPAVLRELGFEPDQVLGQIGFNTAFFSNPDLPISYATAGMLISHCVTATQCTHFGLLLGLRSDPSVLGLPGFLLLNAATVGSALQELNRYMALHDSSGVMILELVDETVLLGFTVVESQVPAAMQIYDLSCALSCNIMRHLCGSDWCATEVLLPRDCPQDTAPWAQFFRAPVRFGASRCVLSFSKHWLDLPVPKANPMLHQILQDYATELQSKRAPSFVADVRHTIRRTMAHDQAKAGHIAQLLGLHERTLGRRLQAQGTTFMDVRVEVIFAMARQLLGNSRLSLREIGTSLGYTSASAFIRAFTQWSGQTPQQWRRSQSALQTAPKKACRAASP